MTKLEILEQLKKGKIEIAEASTLLAALEPQGNGNGHFTMEVSEKGAVHFKNLVGAHHRFGATHYAKTVLAILDRGEEVRKWIEDHRKELSWERVKAAA